MMPAPMQNSQPGKNAPNIGTVGACVQAIRGKQRASTSTIRRMVGSKWMIWADADSKSVKGQEF